MSNSAVDRHLLFGILALQNNFINREALLAAFGAWVVEKRRPLGEILCEQGKLTQLQDELLRALTELHIQQHNNAPEQSLAAVSSVGSLRDDLRKLGDPQVDATLVFVARQGAKSVSASAEAESSGQRFRVLRPHAEGGLGKVSVARDEELNREVALKEMQPRFSDDTASRSRFVLEAEITGGLEHPGIVPVYGLGQYADGRPYYAMRFIRGDSLQEAISQFHKSSHYAPRDEPSHDKPLPGEPSAKETATQKALHAEREGYIADFGSIEFRKLLGRFIDVCQAIEYAHSRGVLHRDLKPGNIMLGKYGETLVVDWGLAKASGKSDHFATSGETTLMPSSGSAVELTQMGAAIGTPAYMSPEQAAGRLDQLGPATDVYSLGATLFHVLTGHSPFVNQPLIELLARVQRGEFPRPSQLNSYVPKALEAVCLKSMAVRPEDRYQTAAVIAEEIERWLADEPVSVYREPLPVRARRIVRRHQVAVTGLAAAVVVALVGLGVLAAVVSGSNQRLNSANITIRNQNSAITTKNVELEVANQHEREATTVAREQSQLALKSLESVIFDIQRKLQYVPGAGDLRRTLLQTALARLQEVSDQFASRAAIDRNTKFALDDLGDVFLRIGSLSSRPAAAAPNSDAEGPLTAASKVYQQAFVIAQKLAAADPTNEQAQRDLAISYNKLGNVSRQAGQLTAAVGHYQKALEISQKQAAAHATNNSVQRDLSISFNKLGELSHQAGQMKAAFEYFQKSLEVSQRLATADPTDVRAQHGLSLSYHNLGNLSIQATQVKEAIGYYEKCLEISQRLATADPADAESQRRLMASYQRLGDVRFQAGQATGALEHYQKCLEISQKLAAADPTDTPSQSDLSVVYSRLGDVSFQVGQITEALGHYQKCLEITERRAAADLTDAQAQRDLSLAYNKLGDVSLPAGQVAEALEYYQKSLEIRQKFAAADATDAQAQFDLFSVYHRIAAAQEEQNHYEQAMESYGNGLKVLQSLKEQNRLAPAHEKWIGIMEESIQQCQHAAMALGDWQTILEQPPELLPVLLNLRGAQFVRKGRTSDAAQAVTKLRELGTATADQLYDAACVYSLCAVGIKAETIELTAEQTAERKKHIADALETLREAIKAGWKDFAHMQKDPDLAVLRDLPEFKAMRPQND